MESTTFHFSPPFSSPSLSLRRRRGLRTSSHRGGSSMAGAVNLLLRFTQAEQSAEYVVLGGMRYANVMLYSDSGKCRFLHLLFAGAATETSGLGCIVAERHRRTRCSRHRPGYVPALRVDLMRRATPKRTGRGWVWRERATRLPIERDTLRYAQSGVHRVMLTRRVHICQLPPCALGFSAHLSKGKKIIFFFV